MSIQFASDLHLEFQANRDWLRENPLQPVGDVLILAGDVMPYHLMESLSPFLDEWAAKWREVYWLPGNHEYYGSDLALTAANLIQPIRKNVFLVNNATIKSGGAQLVFSTLWSKISQINASQISRSVNDFFKIKTNGSLLSVTDFNSLHEQAIAFLESVQFDRGLQRIVVTHHVPTLINYPAQYLTSPINQAFATELGPMIEAIGADYWIFGHHHQNLPEFRIGKTTLLTNQLGYVHLNEQVHFRSDRLLPA